MVYLLGDCANQGSAVAVSDYTICGSGHPTLRYFNAGLTDQDLALVVDGYTNGAVGVYNLNYIIH